MQQLRASSSVPSEASEMTQIIKFSDKQDTVGFKIHSILSCGKITKWDENTEKTYIIRDGKTKRTINLYAIAANRFDVAC